MGSNEQNLVNRGYEECSEGQKAFGTCMVPDRLRCGATCTRTA
jgi:hypothetical protein